MSEDPFLFHAPNGLKCSNCKVEAQHFWLVRRPITCNWTNWTFCLACAFTKTKAIELTKTCIERAHTYSTRAR